MQLEGKAIIVVKRKKYVEDHHDDCGEDLSSLWLEGEGQERSRVTVTVTQKKN